MRRAPSLCGVRRSLSSSTRASSAGPKGRRSGDIASPGSPWSARGQTRAAVQAALLGPGSCCSNGTLVSENCSGCGGARRAATAGTAGTRCGGRGGITAPGRRGAAVGGFELVRVEAGLAPPPTKAAPGAAGRSCGPHGVRKGSHRGRDRARCGSDVSCCPWRTWW